MYGPDVTPTFVLETLATYSCNQGYSLVGDMTRTCTSDASSNGDWSGNEPSCMRKHTTRSIY